MALGGIPFYLEKVEPGLSATQNINKLLFAEKGILRLEFDNLYASLFKKADKHVAIIEALATKAKGIERQELLRMAKIPNGRAASKILKELEQSNFQ